MSNAGWMDVRDAVLAALAAEPVWIQMALALATAFVAVMCLEGIRASFFPRRYAAMLTRKYRPDAEPARAAESSVDGSVQPSRAVQGMNPRRVVRNRKLALSPVNPHVPLRPRIQRAAMVKAAAEAAQPMADSPAADPFEV